MTGNQWPRRNLGSTSGTTAQQGPTSAGPHQDKLPLEGKEWMRWRTRSFCSVGLVSLFQRNILLLRVLKNSCVRTQENPLRDTQKTWFIKKGNISHNNLKMCVCVCVCVWSAKQPPPGFCAPHLGGSHGSCEFWDVGCVEMCFTHLDIPEEPASCVCSRVHHLKRRGRVIKRPEQHRSSSSGNESDAQNLIRKRCGTMQVRSSEFVIESILIVAPKRQQTLICVHNTSQNSTKSRGMLTQKWCVSPCFALQVQPPPPAKLQTSQTPPSPGSEPSSGARILNLQKVGTDTLMKHPHERTTTPEHFLGLNYGSFDQETPQMFPLVCLKNSWIDMLKKHIFFSLWEN